MTDPTPTLCNHPRAADTPRAVCACVAHCYCRGKTCPIIYGVATEATAAAAAVVQVPVEPGALAMLHTAQAEVRAALVRLGQTRADYARVEAEVMGQLTQAEARFATMLEAVSKRHLTGLPGTWGFDPAQGVFKKQDQETQED